MRTIALGITALLLVLAMAVPAVTVTPASAATTTVIFAEGVSEYGRQVRIELSLDGGTTWKTVAPWTPDDGSYEWNVTGPVTSAGRVRVTSLAPYVPLRAMWTDDGLWRIRKLYINLDSPNGGENWTIGTLQIITWSWEPDGSNQDLSDVSDANFTISPPAMTVGSPNGDENWKIGTWQTITWTSDGISGMVGIRLSRDGGRTWETIDASVANDGKYRWNVTGPATTGARIVVVSRTDRAVYDFCDADFTISP